MLNKYGYGYGFILFCFLLQVVLSSSQEYMVFQDKGSRVNWYQALINCRNSGMDLASIHSQQEQNALYDFLRDNVDSRNGAPRYWLGATEEGNGQFYWVATGAKMVFTKWLIDQPDNYGGDQYCLAMGMGTFNSDFVDGGWDDLKCSLQLPYICQSVDYCSRSDGDFNRL
ncbi:echinoidin-like [Dendroctonus ponderosae]|uniref:echinoidin-like n=1 Tax=Dendroctonus ponderosae TaxID=77166 RepID=UPI00203571E8|nr:echinoidin-like [Dendroctonus ponderosae]